MSSRSGNSTNVALIFGGISLISIAGLCLYLYKGKKTIDHKGFKKHIPDKSVTPDVKETEEDAAEALKKKEEALLKETYDDALRFAKKLLLGNAFARAAVKYTEAIEMVPRIPSAKKDLVTLYNNRSAMYEKSGETDLSLLDITQVLSLDIFHIKARTRRARLYETQNMLTEALNDYVGVIFADRNKGSNPSTIEKADEVCRLLAAKKTSARLEEVRKLTTSEDTPLPTKSYCRKFFETLPSVHHWRAKYKDADREELSTRYKSALALRTGEKNTDPSSLLDFIFSAVDLAQMDISCSLFSRAFTIINAAITAVANEAEEKMDDKTKAFMSILWQLKGVECLFKRDDKGGVAAAGKAIAFDGANLEARLVLCILHLELAQITEAREVITSCLSQIEADSPVPAGGEGAEGPGRAHQHQTAWVMVHRSMVWVARSVNGMFTADAIEGSMRDLDIALTITQGCEDEESKCIRIAALLKIINILLQLKIQTGQAPSDADQERVKECVAEAKLLCPGNEEVLMLDAESVASEGLFDEALAMMDKIIAGADPSDTMSTIIKANILMQKAFFSSQTNPAGSAESMALLQEVQGLYEGAIKIEHNALEAMVQCAQLLGMVGDVDKSLEMSTKAVGFTRNREEMQVLIQLILFTEAQIKVSQEMAQ